MFKFSSGLVARGEFISLFQLLDGSFQLCSLLFCPVLSHCWLSWSWLSCAAAMLVQSFYPVDSLDWHNSKAPLPLSVWEEENRSNRSRSRKNVAITMTPNLKAVVMNFS